MAKNIRFVLLSILLMGCWGASYAQGRTVFDFMGLPFSARTCALGGTNISLNEGDLAAMMCNPALLSEQTHNKMQLSYSYYGEGQHFASALYGHNIEYNYLAVGVHYLNYGHMPYADEMGNLTGGQFAAQDLMVDIAYARQLGPMFTIGASLKPVYSAYESYHSFALGADVGGSFVLPESGFSMGLSLQNIGWQLKGFYSDEYGQKLQSLPLNLQLGLSYKLPHAPLRFTFTAHNLQRWNLNYQVSNIGSADSGTSDILYYGDAHAAWYDMLFRHTIWALDIVPKSGKFYLTLSYNHRRRQELTLRDMGQGIETKSLAGFALGAGLNLKGVQIGLAAAQYTRANYVFQFSLGLNMNQLIH